MTFPFQSQGIPEWVNIDESRLQNTGMDLGQTFITFRALHLFGMGAETFLQRAEQHLLPFLPLSWFANPDFYLLLTFPTFWQVLYNMCNLPDWWARQNNRYSCLLNWIPKWDWNKTSYTRQLKEVIRSFPCHHRHHIVPFCKFSKLHLKSSWIFSPLYFCWKAVTESNCSQWLGALF